MTSERYPTTTPEEREAAIEAAALAMQRGALAVIPTDTVYGIAADAFDAGAVASLLAAKGRGREMPPPVLVSTATTLEALAVDVPAWVRTLVDAFWPGPLTVVCKQQPSLQWDLGDTRGTVALRMPDHDLTRDILDRTGPLAVSSANTTGLPAATDADQAVRMLGDRVDVVVDDGPSPGGEASTIVDATSAQGRLLRRGALSLEQLNAVLDSVGAYVSDENGERPPDVAGPQTAVTTTAAEMTAARKSAVKKATTKTPAKRAPAEKSPAKKAPAKKAPVKRTAAKKAAPAPVPDPQPDLFDDGPAAESS